MTKHAGAEAGVRVALAIGQDGMLVFDVVDTGPGFATTALDGGNGFTNMRARLGAIGGSVEVVSVVGQGTRVTGRAPVGTTRGVAGSRG